MCLGGQIFLDKCHNGTVFLAVAVVVVVVPAVEMVAAVVEVDLLVVGLVKDDRIGAGEWGGGFRCQEVLGDDVNWHEDGVVTAMVLE